MHPQSAMQPVNINIGIILCWGSLGVARIQQGAAAAQCTAYQLQVSLSSITTDKKQLTTLLKHWTHWSTLMQPRLCLF